MRLLVKVPRCLVKEGEDCSCWCNWLRHKAFRFLRKRLSFQVSCSYGPGRYDSSYEEGGNDYPLPYIRWTEKRNFEAVLNAISNGYLDVDSLITERVPFENYSEIYDNIGKGNSIASLLVYDIDKKNVDPSNIKITEPKTYTAGQPVLGVIGAGNFTGSTILLN